MLKKRNPIKNKTEAWFASEGEQAGRQEGKLKYTCNFLRRNFAGGSITQRAICTCHRLPKPLLVSRNCQLPISSHLFIYSLTLLKSTHPPSTHSITGAFAQMGFPDKRSRLSQMERINAQSSLIKI